MSVDLYKYAAQNRLRFPSTIGGGNVTLEQLFQLPLRSEVGSADLNTTAKSIAAELKDNSDDDFVGDASVNPKRERLSISLDIVKDVIKTKQEANAAERAKGDKIIQKRKILDAINAKKDEKLTTASIEDLEKMLNEVQ